MSATTTIEWTDKTWNPVTGCSPISDGCAHCYAAKMARRLKAMGSKRYMNGFSVTLHPDLVSLPLHWKKPKRIFVNSMSDLFHEEVPFEFIEEIFRTMAKARQHTFQVLTKRAERLAECATHLAWPPNVWMGVTVESGKYLHRVDLLRNIPSAIRFLSVEPLVGHPGLLNLAGIDWVIAGGESGPAARAVRKEWVETVRDQCIGSGVSFFFKQWGGVNKKKAGRLLDGRTWNQYPVATG